MEGEAEAGRSVEALLERGIAACRRRDAAGALAALDALAGALDFQYDRAARVLAGLYRRARRHLEAGRFGPPRRLLETLRAWAGR